MPRRDVSAERASQQCHHEVEVVRWGRWVADYERCRNKTRHPSGLCWRHRSDFHDKEPDSAAS